jgi:hypothetical protein
MEPFLLYLHTHVLRAHRLLQKKGLWMASLTSCWVNAQTWRIDFYYLRPLSLRCVCVCVSISVQALLHTHTTHNYTHTHNTHTRTHTCTCTHRHTQTHTHTYIHVHTACIHASMHPITTPRHTRAHTRTHLRSLTHTELGSCASWLWTAPWQRKEHGPARWPHQREGEGWVTLTEVWQCVIFI